MNGTQHIVMASGVSAALLTGYGEQALIPAVGIIAGALLPDIDTPDSTIGSVFPMTSRLCNDIFGHRRLLHSVWSAAPFIASGIYFDIPVLLSIGIGIILHLLLDCFTTTGIRPVFPIRGRISMYRGKTSGVLGWSMTIGLQAALYYVSTETGILGMIFRMM